MKWEKAIDILALLGLNHYTAKVEWREENKQEKIKEGYDIFVEQNSFYEEDTKFFNDLCAKFGLSYYIDCSEHNAYFWDNWEA